MSEPLRRAGPTPPSVWSLLERIVVLEARMTRREDAAIVAQGEHPALRLDIDHVEKLLTDPERGVFAQIQSLKAEVRQNRRDIIVAVTILIIAANFIVPYVIAALGGPR